MEAASPMSSRGHPSYKDAGQIGLGPTLMTSLNLIAFVETIFPKAATHQGAWGRLEPQHTLVRGCSSLVTECQGQNWQWSAGRALPGMEMSWSWCSWL